MSEHNDFSSQIQALDPKPGDLMVIHSQTWMTREQHEAAIESLTPFAECIGCRVLILQPGMSASMLPDPAAQQAELRKQTLLLESIASQQSLLVRALAEGGKGDVGEAAPVLSDGRTRS